MTSWASLGVFDYFLFGYNMKQWMEKEWSQWVYYDDEDGKIIGAVYKIGTSTGIWGGRIYLDNNMENQLGQFIDSDWARRAVERYWEIAERTLLE